MIAGHLHFNKAATQAKKVWISILRQSSILNDLTFKTHFKIFDTKVIPILVYGAEIWGMKVHDQIEKVNLFACKNILESNITPLI